MEHTCKYYITDNIHKNPSGLYDIVIYKPEFVNYNVKEVMFSLQDESEIKSELINNLDYLIIGTALIYKGKTKSDSNIFPVQDIPLSYIKRHIIIMVIKNIDAELKDKIFNKKIVFRWTETNVYPVLNPDNSHTDVSIKWSTGLEQGVETNELRIISNMVGIQTNILNFDKKYIEENSELHSYSDSCKYLLLNVNHLDELYQYKPKSLDNFDYYCSDKLVELLLYKNRGISINSELYVPLISETCKIFGRKINQINLDNLFKYQIKTPLHFDGIDAISNIKLLCDNSKYLVKKISLIQQKYKVINNNYTNFENNVDIEYKSESYGYKAIGMDNFLVSITILSKRCDILIEFETNVQLLDNELDDFVIVYDRMCFDVDQRKNLGLNMDVIEEYYITDITDYYKKKIN